MENTKEATEDYDEQEEATVSNYSDDDLEEAEGEYQKPDESEAVGMSMST